MITFRDMKDAPLWLQWFSWKLILGFLAFFITLATTHIMSLLPMQSMGLDKNPETAIEWLQFPPFIFFFAVLWIGAAAAVFFKAPQETYDTFFWAAGGWTVIIVLAFCIPYINEPIDCAFDRVRINYILNQNTEDDVAKPKEKKTKKTTPTKKKSLEEISDEKLAETATLSLGGGSGKYSLSDEPNAMPSKCEFETVMRWLEEYPEASTAKLEAIYVAFNPDYRVTQAVLNAKNCPDTVWSDLVDKAANGLPPFEHSMRKPLQGEPLELLKALARHPKISADWLPFLLLIPGLDLREEVAANPNLTEAVRADYQNLILPFLQESAENKLLAARTPETVPYLLVYLAWESDPLIRAAIARNPSTPLSTVKKLTLDSDSRVKKFALASFKERSPKKRTDDF
jgi:hypothetical protein